MPGAIMDKTPQRQRHPGTGCAVRSCVVLVFTLVWVRPVKALAGQTVTCTAVVETDADASYSESRLRGTLRLTEIDGRAANVKVQCASFPGESAGEQFTAKLR